MINFRSAFFGGVLSMAASAAAAAAVVPDTTPGTAYSLSRYHPVTGKRDRGVDGVQSYLGGYRINISTSDRSTWMTEYVGMDRVYATRGGATTDFFGFCVEPYRNAVMRGGTFTVAGSLGQTMPSALAANSSLVATREDAMDRLFSNAFSLVTNDTAAMAFQLAIWEITNESGATFGAGGDFKFRHRGGSPIAELNKSLAAVALANSWLTKLNGSTEFQSRGKVSYATFLSDREQNFIGAASAAPVPLPAAAALLPVAFGLLGFAARRRRS